MNMVSVKIFICKEIVCVLKIRDVSIENSELAPFDRREINYNFNFGSHSFCILVRNASLQGSENILVLYRSFKNIRRVGRYEHCLNAAAASGKLGAKGRRNLDRKSTRLNSSHRIASRMPSSA